MSYCPNCGREVKHKSYSFQEVYFCSHNCKIKFLLKDSTETHEEYERRMKKEAEERRIQEESDSKEAAWRDRHGFWGPT